MVINHTRQQRLKPLLNSVPPGFIVDSAWLRAQGSDPKSIHHYVEHGWLERVIRGVYRRPLPKSAREGADTEWQVALVSLQWIMNRDVHLGGESALALAGFTHYLTLGNASSAHVYGEVPAWLRRLPAGAQFVVHSRTLFGDDPTGLIEADRDGPSDGPETTSAPTVAVWRWPIKASSPERAILEAIDELPNRASFHNLDMIFEGLVSLRPKQLGALLATCRSVKVRRLFFVFADRHRHAWRKYLDASKINFGSGPRALVPGGALHPTYRIYVPADLVAASAGDEDSHA